MKRTLLGALLALALLLAVASPAQAGARAAASGAWSDPGTWGGGVPGPGDAVTIPDGRTVTVDTAARAGSVDVAEGGMLAFAEDNDEVSAPAPAHALFLDEVRYPAELYLPTE